MDKHELILNLIDATDEDDQRSRRLRSLHWGGIFVDKIPDADFAGFESVEAYFEQGVESLRIKMKNGRVCIVFRISGGLFAYKLTVEETLIRRSPLLEIETSNVRSAIRNFRSLSEAADENSG